MYPRTHVYNTIPYPVLLYYYSISRILYKSQYHLVDFVYNSFDNTLCNAILCEKQYLDIYHIYNVSLIHSI